MEGALLVCWQNILIRKGISTRHLIIKKREVFVQLEQILGIRFDKRKINNFFSLCCWDTEEDDGMLKMKGINTSDTIFFGAYIVYLWVDLCIGSQFWYEFIHEKLLWIANQILWQMIIPLLNSICLK